MIITKAEPIQHKTATNAKKSLTNCYSFDKNSFDKTL